MKQFEIKLPLINDIKEFVNIMSRHPYAVEAVSGRYKVDAKSIMGLFSLDLSKPIKINAYTNDDKLKEELSRFLVA